MSAPHPKHSLKVIKHLEAQLREAHSEIINNNLGHMLMKKRHDDIVAWMQLRKPHVAKLIAVVEENIRRIAEATTAAAKRRRKGRR